MSPSRSRSSLPTTSKRKPPPDRGGYFFLSRQPWQVLCFLLPFIIAYEIGSVVFLSSPSGEITRTVSAHRIMSSAFDMFGAAGIHIPAVTIVVVLLCWQLMVGGSWKIRWGVLAGMAAESAIWTFPLLVLVALLKSPAFAETGASDPQTWSVGARFTISVGAGLYEELLFRMVAIAAAHFVMVDLLRASPRVGAVSAVLIAALAFGFYHADTGPLLLFAAGGAYFGTLFMMRGFGIVVGTHAVYDIIALILVHPQ